jgi:hypothetical protein
MDNSNEPQPFNRPVEQLIGGRRIVPQSINWGSTTPVPQSGPQPAGIHPGGDWNGGEKR